MTGLPDRTLRYALARLKQAGMVEARRTLGDARRKLFFLVDRRPSALQEAPQFTQKSWE